MCTVYTDTNTYMLRFCPSGFLRPSRCLFPIPGLTSEYRICAVCVYVCVYTHLHPHTLPPALKIEKTQTTPLSLLQSKITSHAKQQVPSYTSWAPPSSFPNAEWTNCTYMSAYAHPAASVYTNVYADFHNTCLMYTPAHAWCSQHLLKCMHTLRQKCTCTHACAPTQWCRSFFAMEAIANLSWVFRQHRAGCRLPPALLVVSTKPVARRCSLKKSVETHDSSWCGRRWQASSSNGPRTTMLSTWVPWLLRRLGGSNIAYQKFVLFAVLDGISERGWNCIDTSNLTFTIGESSFITIKDLLGGLSTVV